MKEPVSLDRNPSPTPGGRGGVGGVAAALAALLIACEARAPTVAVRPATPRGGIPARAPERPAAPPPAPAAWRDVAPGVAWRAADVAFDAPPPTPVAWATSPSRLRWVVVRLDLARATPTVATAPQRHLADVAGDPNVLAAVNGGFFEPDDSASGLVVRRGARLHDYGPRGGSGVLVVRDGRADVVAAADRPPLADPGVALAVQCGPRLVERGGVVGIHRDDGHRFARTAACVRDGGRTLDLVVTWAPADPLRGPGLLQLARMLAGPSPVGDPRGCELALNLDGGPSTGVFVRDAGDARHDPVGPTPWLIVVPRP